MEPRTTPPAACDHCGRPSSSLLRCAACRAAWYCDRACQSAAWPPSDDGTREGHRTTCRRMRKLREKSEAASADAKARDAMMELMEKVQTMGRGEAYRQMCLAEDEIKRLESLGIHDDVGENSTDELDASADALARGDANNSGEEEARKDIDATTSTNPERSNNNHRQTIKQSVRTKERPPQNIMRAKGSWIEGGGACSVEYLPNIMCYQITLTSAEQGESSSPNMPQSKEEMHFEMVQIDGPEDNESSTTAFWEGKLYRLEDLLLSIALPIPCHGNVPESASCRISMDGNSVSLRIQLPLDVSDMTDASDHNMVDMLLGAEESSFASVTTGSTELNYLRCRSCQNPIVGACSDSDGRDDSATIKSVLPLPTGYWDDITDYLICYDGQANVDFSSSSTSAVRGAALEDDAVLVLHSEDLAEEGVRTVGSKGYGEHSSKSMDGTAENRSASQAWKDKSASKDERIRPVTCSQCCSTLGFVSDHDAVTYRLYKHLLDCGKPAGASSTVFSKYTCGSFLAREMVRYAESEAIYTFIVGVSDDFDWTRAHSPGEVILLRILSWDTPMATVGSSCADQASNDDNDDTLLNAIHFQKVVKVIFEETSGRTDLATASDDPLQWAWRGTDFCCLPPTRNEASNTDGMAADGEGLDVMPQMKASSTRIYFSQREWTQLRDALTNGSRYFSEAVKDAIVMAKLGPASRDGDQTATLSFLPLVS